MSKPVRKTLTDSPMTPARKRKLTKLAAQPNSEIDLSDIPALDESFWKNAIRNPFCRPVKQQLTVAAGRRCGGVAPEAREGLSDQTESGASGSHAGRRPEERLTDLPLSRDAVERTRSSNYPCGRFLACSIAI
jgi:hypothetical protein